MMSLKSIGFIFLSLLLATTLYSQSRFPGSVSGKVIDSKSNQPIESAVIKLLTAKDSTSTGNAVSNKTGDFTITNQAPGSYLLKLSFIGFKSLLMRIEIANGKTSVGTLGLEAGVDLETISVIGEAVAITVKRDTIEYNTISYKTIPNANVEDLLKKLPGMEVEKDGTIKASGVTVTKVTIDGKEFFGTNTKAATQNLPADAIAKVEVIDDKTDQAKASGIDKGDRDKIVNLVLKEDKKSGWFGGSSLAGGTESRYVGSLGINHFSKDTQFNIILGSNNVNQGFSADDGANFLGGANTSALPGLNKTYAAGVNFSDAWGKKNGTKFSGSYIGSKNSSDALILQDIQNTQATGIFYSNSNNASTNDNQVHRFNIRMISALDSLTTLTFTPSLSFTNRKSLSTRNFSQKNSSQQKLNDGITITDNDSYTPAFNGNLSLSKKFKAQKGTLSLSLYGYYNDASIDNINNTTNNYYSNNTHQLFNRLETQDRLNNFFSITPGITHTISKDKKTSAFLSGTISLNTNNADRKTTDYNPATGNYEKLLDSLTNNNESQTRAYSVSVGLNKTSIKWIVNATYGLSFTNLNGNTTGKSQFEKIGKNYSDLFLPYLYVSYKPKATTSYTFNSYINFFVPQVADLFLIQYNPDPLNVRLGNPGLKEYKQYFNNLNYRKSNPKRNSSLSINITFNRYDDFISSSRVFDTKTGIQSTKAINVDGNYSLVFGSEINLPTKIKGLRIGTGPNIQQNRTIGLVDNKKNISDRLSEGAGLNFIYAYKDKLNFTWINRLSHIHVNNSTQPNFNSDYFDLTNSLSFSYEFVKNWRINTDFSRVSSAGQKVVLFNSGIQKFFMAKRQLSLEFKGFDLLNQNSDISRVINSNLVTDTRTNNIGQYFYMKLVYRVNKLGTPSAPAGR
jgi:hypothetical protein